MFCRQSSAVESSALLCFPFCVSLVSVFCRSLPNFSARHLQRIGFPPYVHSTFMSPLTQPLTRTRTPSRSLSHSQARTLSRTPLISSRSSLSVRLTFSYRIKNGILFHENVLSGTEGAEKPVLYEENVLDGTKRCVTWII